MESQRTNQLNYTFRQLPPVYWIGLYLSCAPEIRRNTKDDRKRASSIRSLLLMRLCCWRSIDVGKPTSFLSRGLHPCLVNRSRESGGGLRSRPRIAKQVPGPSGPLSAKNDPLDHFSGATSPKKSDRWLIELARIRQLSTFSLAPDGSLQPHKAKLAEIA